MNKTLGRILVSLPFLAILAALALGLIRSTGLKRRGIVIEGRTEEWRYGSQASRRLAYTFTFNGKEYRRFQGSSDLASRKELEYRPFPVLFDSVWAGSYLLMERKHFKKFGLSYPDSLLWVEKLK